MTQDESAGSGVKRVRIGRSMPLFLSWVQRMPTLTLPQTQTQTQTQTLTLLQTEKTPADPIRRGSGSAWRPVARKPVTSRSGLSRPRTCSCSSPR